MLGGSAGGPDPRSRQYQLELARQNDAIARGRHPSSFARTRNAVWQFVRRSDDMVKRVQAGRSLASTVQAPALRSSTSAPSLQAAGRSTVTASPTAAAAAEPPVSPATKHPLLSAVLGGATALSPSPTPHRASPAAADGAAAASSPPDANGSGSRRHAPAAARGRSRKSLWATAATAAAAGSGGSGSAGLWGAPKPPRLPSAARRTQEAIDGVRSRHLGPSNMDVGVAAVVVAARAKVSSGFLATSTDTQLCFGNKVALEFHDGRFLCLDTRTGSFCLKPPTQANFKKRRVMPFRQSLHARFTFKVVDMKDPNNTHAVRYGDDVWLSAVEGRGETGWKSGSVIGASLRNPVVIDTVKHFAEPAPDRSRPKPGAAKPMIGRPFPVEAYMPAPAEDFLVGPQTSACPSGRYKPTDVVYPVLYQERTEKQRVVAKWKLFNPVVRVSGPGRRFVAAGTAAGASAGGGGGGGGAAAAVPVLNKAQIGLSQDWYYIAGPDNTAADSNVVLEPLPAHDLLPKLLPFNVKRQGVWAVHVVSHSGHMVAATTQKESLEHLALRARDQLSFSEDFRNGRLATSIYGDGLLGGTQFPAQLRRKRVGATLAADTKYLSFEADKAADCQGYFAARWNAASESMRDSGGSSPATHSMPPSPVPTDDGRSPPPAPSPPSPPPAAGDGSGHPRRRVGHGKDPDRCTLCLGRPVNLCKQDQLLASADTRVEALRAQSREDGASRGRVRNKFKMLAARSQFEAAADLDDRATLSAAHLVAAGTNAERRATRTGMGAVAAPPLALTSSTGGGGIGGGRRGGLSEFDTTVLRNLRGKDSFLDVLKDQDESIFAELAYKKQAHAMRELYDGLTREGKPPVLPPGMPRDMFTSQFDDG